MEAVKSPITGNFNTRKLDEYKKSITSESKLVVEAVSNFQCLDSGLIFNNLGARGKEVNFYEDEYDLHSESLTSEFKYSTNIGYTGIYENINQFIINNIPISSKGKLLDLGCGKGLLLKNFNDKFPKWKLFGIEPSKNAKIYHEKIIPNVEVSFSDYKGAKLSSNKFDIITSNGVLEHVPDPLDFLEFIHNNLDDDGFCFIGVPNFINNPVDIFTYDHLSRFTPSTLENIFKISGFKVANKITSNERVPMWYIIKKTVRKSFDVGVNIDTEYKNFKKNKIQVNKTFDSIDTCLENHKNEKIVVYGTGAIFLIYFHFNNIDIGNIKCFIDDNETIHGSSKLGLKIFSPNYIIDKGFNNIIISSNPCYHRQIINKIKCLGINKLNIYY